MSIRPDWGDWDLWGKLWDEWVRFRKGEKNIAMEHIQFIDLYNFFVRQVKALGVDPHTVDVKAFIDPKLTYSENKSILAEILAVPPTEAEYASMYESFRHELEEQVKEKYPDVWATWQKQIEQLEKETEALPKVERERAKFKKLSEDLAYKLEETVSRFEEEKKALEKRVAPVKLRIIRAFREGIIDYTIGSVVESRDIDWALSLIDRGLAERVAVEVPVEVKPKPPPTAPPEEIFRRPPPKVEVDRELERKLRDVFETTLRIGLPTEKLPGLSPTRFIPEFRLELDAVKTLPTEAEMIRAIEELAKSIIRRESKPAPPKLPLPPGWRETENGYLTPEGEFVPKEEFPRYVRPEVVPPEVRTRFLDWMKRFLPPGPERKAISLHPRDWLLSRYNLTWGEFLKLPPDEAKMLLDKYERECREGR